MIDVVLLGLLQTLELVCYPALRICINGWFEIMFGLTPDAIVMLTVIAGFSQAAVLSLTLYVFYRNLLVLKRHNELTIDRFTFQSNVEKYDLSLKLADWVKSELSDYVPYVIGDTKHEHLTKDEIEDHFENIAEVMIKLIDDKIVFKCLMTDEIKKMHITLEQLSGDETIIKSLRKLMDWRNYFY